MLDPSGAVVGRQAHLPFGEEFGTSGGQQKQRFTSYERDAETATDYAVNRQYGQTVGRFQQADRYRASGSLVNPQSWNHYSYGLDDSTNNIDFEGLFSTLLWALEGWPGRPPRDGCTLGGGGHPASWEWMCPGSGGASTGTGTGSSPVRGGRAPSPGHRVKQYFATKAGKKCEEFFNGHPRLAPSWWIEHVATYAEWIDVTAPDLRDKTFSELGISTPDPGTQNDRVSRWLGPGRAPDGQRYWAFTNLLSDSWTAYIGKNYQQASPGRQALIAVHESLHMANHIDDAGLAAMLGITVSAGKEPSEAISSFLAAGCPRNFTYP
jgi:RHS repeat-associated protein